MNITNKIMVATLLTISMSSCGIYSKFEAPTEVVEVNSLYNYIEASNNTTNIASVAWRDLFVDPQLQQLIEKGLANNTDLNVARLNVEQAEVALKTARLSYLPSLNFNPTGSLTSQNSTTTKSYNLSVAASWEVDLFGKLRNAKEQSRAALEQSTAYRQAVQTQLISTIANSYYSLVMLDEQLDISRRTLVNWDENLRVMEALKKAGRINQTSVLQSEASRISLMGSIVSLEQQIVELENSISVLLAIAPQHIARGKMSNISFPSELSVGVPIQLISNRPDIRAAEYTLAQAFYATGEARSSLYPSITLSGSAGYTNSGVSISNPGDMLYNAVASILQPIFNRGALRGQLKISQAQQEQALLAFKQAILDAGAEVNIALTQWQTANKLIGYDEAELEVLTKALQSSELLMKHGNSNYLEVLTAQLTLLQAELSRATNRFAQVQGVIDLYRAVGGGEQ